MRHIKPDDTWRLVWRDAPQGVGPEVDGKDCYAFQRAGGERPTDVWTMQIITVESFWGKRITVERRIRELLSEVYLPAGVDIWLAGRNRNLGDRAANDLIAADEGELVLSEVQRLVGGAW